MQQFPVSIQEQDEALKAIQKSLRKNYKTDARIVAWWTSQVAAGLSSGLTQERALVGLPSLANSLKLPQWVFQDLPEQFTFFDFNGDRTLNLSETRKMIKHLLVQRCQSLSGGIDYDLDDVEVAMPEQKGYRHLVEVGRGGQGVAYEATNNNGKHVLLKFFDKSQGSAALMEVIEEMAKMRELNNPHIAKTLEVFHDSRYIYMANELYSGGDWSKLGANVYDANVSMSEDWWRTIFRQALTGLNYLHQQAQMHCDLKEPNIMFANKEYKRPRVVLIDFGLARGFAQDQDGASGTPGYIPPETWQSGAWHPLGDTFSMGVVMFQLLTGQVPIENMVPGVFVAGASNLQDVMRITISKRLPLEQLPQNFNIALLGPLIDDMTAKDLWGRPRVKQCLADRWFSAKTDEPLPPQKVQRLIQGGRESVVRSRLVEDLADQNNLAELRELRAQLVHKRNKSGKIRKDYFVGIVGHYGASGQDFADFFADGQGFVAFQELIDKVMLHKKRSYEQTLFEMFSAIDDEEEGYITTHDARYILSNPEAFSALEPDDIDDMVDEMTDANGCITFDAFRYAVLRDGRLDKRADMHEVGKRPFCRNPPCEKGCTVS